MSALLLVTAFGLKFLVSHTFSKDWRVSLLQTSIVFGCFVTLITEVLDLLSEISFNTVFSVWVIVNVLLLIFYLRLKKRSFPRIRFSDFLNTLTQSEYFLIGAIAILSILIFIVDIIAAPNNVDSIHYHLPRVFYWAQNRSIQHYPTHYLPQIYQPPFSGFFMLHLKILSGGDKLSSLLQYLSMLGCLVGVSLISQELGAKTKGQILASVVCATIPVGILHASNSNNTYVVSFWLVCLAYFSIIGIKNGLNSHHLLWIGSSLALAILTKGTAYLYGFPFCVWLGLSTLFKGRYPDLVKTCLILSFTTLGINLGHYIRNFQVFGDVISTGSQKWTPDSISLTSFLSSLVKNISVHLALPLSENPVNEFLEQSVYRLHDWMGIDISDPRFSGTYFNFQAQSRLFEDLAGNPLHFWLITVLFIGFLLRREIFLRILSRENREDFSKPYEPTALSNQLLTAYSLAILGGFCLFCFSLKWEIYHTRLHLPVFVLFSAFCGVVLERIYQSQYKFFAQIILIILIIFSSPFALKNESRPLLGSQNIFNTSRMEQFLKVEQSFLPNANNRSKDIYALMDKNLDDYLRAIELIRNEECYQVGLLIQGTRFEYPLLNTLEQEFGGKVTLRHVEVANVSSKLYGLPQWQDFNPCLTFTLKRSF